jgi:putative transposase
VQLRYAYRLDPTPGQRITLARAFGCARVVFNDAIAARRVAHEVGAPYPTDAQLSRALTAAKRTPQRAWLSEVSAVVLQQALADANTAYRNFFAAVPGAQRLPAIDPIHQGSPVPRHRRRSATTPGGRGRRGPLVS